MTNWEIPMLCLDYGFFHDEGKPLITMLVVPIKPVNVYFAAVVTNKGSYPEVVKQLATWIQESGLIHFVYRADLEASL